MIDGVLLGMQNISQSIFPWLTGSKYQTTQSGIGAQVKKTTEGSEIFIALAANCSH
jgi:hypothetical protein